MEKYNKDKQLLFKKKYSNSMISDQDGMSISGITASNKGNLCYYSPDGVLFLCDESGDIIIRQKLSITGVKGIALGNQEKAVIFSCEKENLVLFPIDMEEGTVAERMEVSYPAMTVFHRLTVAMKMEFI